MNAICMCEQQMSDEGVGVLPVEIYYVITSETRTVNPSQPTVNV